MAPEQRAPHPLRCSSPRTRPPWRALGALWLGLALQASSSLAATPVPPSLTTLNSSLSNPWSMAVLPSGELLVTQREGSLLRVSANGASTSPIRGVLPVNSNGQGGLLGLAIDPDFATAPWVYWSYAESGSDREIGLTGTAVARGRLVGNTLQDVAVLFRQQPKTTGSGHFGARLVFARDKTLFITLGDRQKFSPAQDLAQTLGKVVRIARDGRMPADNPPLGPRALPGIWSLGHRNPQGAALHPETGELWVSEHGPQGGDEINIARAGANYGWPLRSYGCPYGDPVGTDCRIGGGVHAPEFVEPLATWTPTSVAPSGMLFYTGDVMPQWKGNLFSASLAGQTLWRMAVSPSAVLSREAVPIGVRERLRDVAQAKDGAILLLTDSGKLLRLAP